MKLFIAGLLLLIIAFGSFKKSQAIDQCLDVNKELKEKLDREIHVSYRLACEYSRALEGGAKAVYPETCLQYADRRVKEEPK